MRQKARLKASFVITIAGTVAQSAACGGTTVESSETASGTGGSTESGGAPTRTSGGTGSGGAPTHTGGVLIGGAGGTGGAMKIILNPPGPVVTECPASPPFGAAVTCPATGKCTETLVCASQSKTFTVDCDPMQGFRIDEACNLPYDHCTRPGKPGEGADCVNGAWRLLVGGPSTNPPAPCPAEAPAVGQACRFGSGFGADREHCGYRCPDGTGWTVIGCATTGAPADANGFLLAAWQSDGACNDGGIPP
jgi:hypothetical protein